MKFLYNVKGKRRPATIHAMVEWSDTFRSTACSNYQLSSVDQTPQATNCLTCRKVIENLATSDRRTAMFFHDGLILTDGSERHATHP